MIESPIVRCQATSMGRVESDHVIGKLELEERHGFSRSVVPWKTGVAREIPRLNHVGIFFVECSAVFS